MAPNPDLACGILTNIGELWLEEEFCDLTINIDDFQFRCHKFHLSANSTFFKTLLRSEKTDGSSNSISHVTIRGIDPEIFGLVLKAVYKGENCVDENNMIQVWHAAHELQIDVLVSKCEDFVMAHMTLDNYENIYHSSILLESTRITEFVLDFMAKIFERFSHTSLFLDLPSKFLMDIVSSKALVVESREGLVDSILGWALHKSEEEDETGDDITVKANVNDLSGMTKGDQHCVEIMFSQPPAGLEDESSRRKLSQILQETERREETLGKLLNLAKLEQTSPDYLDSLVNNDWLMGNKEARITVWTVMKASLPLKAPTSENVSKPLTTFPSFDNLCKDAVVYILKDCGTAVVHRCTTGKRYKLLTNPDFLKSQLLDIIYSKTTVCLQSNTSGESTVKLIANGIDSSHVDLKLLRYEHHPAFVKRYLYYFTGYINIRRRDLSRAEEASESWHFAGSTPMYGKRRWTAVHEETIIMSFFREGSSRSKDLYEIYSFDTSSLSFKYLGQIDPVTDYDGIIYINNEMYILQPNGALWRVSLTSDPGYCLIRITKLWDFNIQIYRVIKLQDDLIIFANLPVKKTLPTYWKDLNLNLKFVQAWPSDKVCRHVWLPQSWLGEEV